jgi:hypothetical protein
VSELTFPDGYQGRRVTLDQLRQHSTFANLHPEMRRRVEAMMIASGGTIGIGTGYRSPASQDAEYQRRRQLQAQGVHTAPMTPSSRSWHCAGGAVDLVGDTAWAGVHAPQFGLLQATWGGETWHFQPVELPHARPAGALVDEFIGHHGVPDVHEPQPVPAPPVHVGDDDDMVLILEDVRTGAIYKCVPGGGMYWIQDGVVAQELFKRRDEAAEAPDGRSPVDGMRYHYLRHGGDHVISGYGPILNPDGALPPGTDRWGRVGS